ELLAAHRLRVDLDTFDLFAEIGGGQRLQHRRHIARVELWYCERFTDRVARQDRRLVQQVHRVAQQDLGLEILRPIGGQQVVQVKGEGRIGQTLAAVAARGQVGVAPAGVR